MSPLRPSGPSGPGIAVRDTFAGWTRWEGRQATCTSSRIDRGAAIIDVDLDGTLRAEDTARFVRELQEAIAALVGREIRMKIDARTLRPVAPEVAEMLRAVQAIAIRSGVRRIAELVGGGVVALQLGRVAQESGADRILRRFVDERAAREWVREADSAEPARRSGRRLLRAALDAEGAHRGVPERPRLRAPALPPPHDRARHRSGPDLVPPLGSLPPADDLELAPRPPLARPRKRRQAQGLNGLSRPCRP